MIANEKIKASRSVHSPKARGLMVRKIEKVNERQNKIDNDKAIIRMCVAF